MSTALATADPELAALIAQESTRQRCSINLIASENITSNAVLECLGSCLTNKYSEGQPGNRYYGGTGVVDAIENLCQKRCLDAFHLDPTTWGVNVQALSGSPANLAVYLAFLQPHERFMGLLLTEGGHLTHGYYTAKKRISASSVYYEPLPYRVDPDTGRIDYDALRRDALAFKPKLIVCGASAYPRYIDFERCRVIADAVGNGCLLMADIAHIAGLVAAGVHPSPFEYCDIVTTTTHKTLRGPRSGLIFVNKQRMGAAAMDQLNRAVFPGLQGGPHNNQIAAVACQMREVCSPEWRKYAERVVQNAKALAARLVEHHHQTLVTGGTDNHLILWDLRPVGISGSKLEKVAEAVGITLNKNTVPGDVSAFNPSGVRIGSPAMTSRGCGAKEMVAIADFLMECVEICLQVQASVGVTLAAFTEAMHGREDISSLKQRVTHFAEEYAALSV